MLTALAALGFALVGWQWVAAIRFPLHQRCAKTAFAPGVTLLKPVKGADATSRESLQTWFRQEYSGPVQILLAVADAADPAVPVIRQLLAEYPAVNAQLVVCTPLTGANAKVAKLTQLEKLAQHDLLLVSDADVRVPVDFLANVVQPLTEPKNALVCCFYRLANPINAAMRWEAVAINADFWSQVLQSASMKPVDFALGAVMLVRRAAVAEFGGFASMANCLADDYQLGHRVAKNGHRIALCPVVVECWDAPAGWSAVWKHQLRWARTIRVCQPVPYFLSILANGSLWSLLLLLAAVGVFHSVGLAFAAVLFLLLRIGLANDLQRRFTPERKLVSPAWLVPVKDVLNFGIWLGAFAGNTIEWRGRRMRLRPDGTLVELGGEGFNREIR